MEEQKLAARCAKGDREAQRELYEQYGSRILALCRRYAADQADAEDLKQDAFIRIFQVIDRFRWTRPGSLYSWMSRVTINLAFDSAKRRRNLARQLENIDDLEDVIPENPSYEEEVSTVPPEVLSEMIDALPEGYRTVFKLYCIDGLAHKEIASLLGIKEKSSSASLSRARALLTDEIEQYWKEQDEGASAEGWSRILSKMRRAKALRSGLIALAILLPATSLLLWRTSHQPSAIIAEAIPSAEDSKDVTLADAALAESTEKYRTLDIAQGGTGAFTAISEDAPVIPSGSSSIPSDSEEYDLPEESGHLEAAEGDAEALVPAQADIDAHTVIPGQIGNPQRKRPRISLSFQAGTGPNSRSSEFSLLTAPYITALTYMNYAGPDMALHVKSNYNNTMEWLYANSSNISPSHNYNDYRHDLPISLGISARMELTPRLGAESGIEYTCLHSTLESTTVPLEQYLHMIGIPVKIDTRIWSRNRLDFYVGLGAKIEKCVSASLGNIRCEEKRLQLSAEAFTGAQYRIGARSHLYFQPELSYSLTKTDLITYRTENPLVFTLNAGLRFDL